MRPERPDHYAALGVSAAATPRQITHAYRALVRALHPDTTTAAGDTLARFTAVTTAYKILHDPARRAAYDRSCHTEPAARTPPARTAVYVDVRAAPPADALRADPLPHRDPRPPLLRAGPTRVSPLPRPGP
jgi:curved DNA-binding protein CbpA